MMTTNSEHKDAIIEKLAREFGRSMQELYQACYTSEVADNDLEAFLRAWQAKQISDRPANEKVIADLFAGTELA